jgi:Flagellar FliJ protein.
MREYKSRILDEEQGTLLRLKDEQTQIEQAIEKLQTEFQNISAQMQVAQIKGTTVMELQGFSMQLDTIRLQLKELQAALLKAVQKVEKQTKVVIAANQEVSKLDKLQDKQYEAYRHKEEKAEELRIEEIVVQGVLRKDAG